MVGGKGRARMYKVKDSDVIFRTHEQVKKMDESGRKMIGPNKSDVRKIRKLDNKLSEMTEKPEGVTHNDIVKIIYKILDLMNGHTSKFSVCQVGCSHCCRIGVDVSSIEAMYIQSNTDYEGREPVKGYKHIENEYCVFHDDETASCSIYEFRPAHCRIFFAFDSPVYCNDPKGIHAISTDHGMSPDEYVNKLMAYLLNCGRGEYHDVRAWFSGEINNEIS